MNHVPPRHPAAGIGRTRRVLLATLASASLVAAWAPQPVSAQTPFVPYFGKNQVRYDNFRWQIYTTDHFEIYYYPETEPHLERVAGYAESAYQHISSELRHDLAFKVPLIVFKTSSEFQTQNVVPGAAQEGVGAFAEPMRQRIVLPIDDPPDLLYRLIVHELAHQFQYDIIPTSLIRRNVPLWVNEGQADYLTGIWQPLDLSMVRDAAVSDIVPKMSKMDEYGGFENLRMVYNLGHAVFEFIESRWGKEGVRQFMFALRKSVIGGGDDAYQEAFKLAPEEFDQQFDKYLKDRFKAFRDKERPSDYGRNLAPDPEKGPFTSVVTVEPSPSGDLMVIATGNRKDGELDYVIVSAKDGSIVRNLTNGFNQDKGFEFVVQPGGRFNTVPWISWSPNGDRVAYFVRQEKSRSLIVQNILNRDIVQRFRMRTVDDPESPDISPDGRRVAFAALQNGVGDIYVLDLESGDVTNVTKDAFGDSGPTWAPDGRSIVYVARISGNEKLFRVDVATGAKTQLTFGTHDDAAAQFLDNDTLVFSSTATDPARPLEAEVVRNGNIYNIWTLSLRNGELRQYTDAVVGNLSPVVLRDGNNGRIAFVSVYKGLYELHVLERRDPIATAASADFGAAGPVIDFQAPLTHSLIAANKRKKGAFEKMFLDGRPPVNVGVTSGGDVFGGSAVTFSDVLGDKQFSMYAASISQYRTLAFAYTNVARRFNYAFQGYSQTSFFYGNIENVFYDPSQRGFFLDRDFALATTTIRGGSAFGIWPISKYRRLEFSGGVTQYRQQFNDPGLQSYSDDYQVEQFGRRLFQNGTYVPLGVSYVQETTVFREFGPLAGNTMRLAYEVSPNVGDTLSRQTLDLDARYYRRIGGSGVLALRARSFRSWGEAPTFIYFGGNSEMRGYDYLEFLGSKSSFFNAELRFPLIEAMLTPIGVMGGIRGVFFANMGGGHFDGQNFRWWTNKAETYTPIIDYNVNNFNNAQTPVFGEPRTISGLRLVDARASYGIGLQTFALGFPVHFDWAWRTLFNREWEDALFAAQGGSHNFRKAQFQVWMGYDF